LRRRVLATCCSTALSETTATWSAGNNGALDTGTIAASTWYHVHVIKNPTTGAVDALVSLNPSAPTMPSRYTLSRRVGSLLTDSSKNWNAFVQFGDDFFWTTPKNDWNNNPISTSDVLKSWTVPTSIKVKLMISTPDLARIQCSELLRSNV
jgi:hypothetical protein